MSYVLAQIQVKLCVAIGALEMAILTFFRRADESQGLHISISVKRGTPAKTQDTLIQS